jgi:hypothetical protein
MLEDHRRRGAVNVVIRNDANGLVACDSRPDPLGRDFHAVHLLRRVHVVVERRVEEASRGVRLAKATGEKYASDGRCDVELSRQTQDFALVAVGDDPGSVTEGRRQSGFSNRKAEEGHESTRILHE